MFFNSMFLEDGEELHQKVTLPDKHSETLYGHALFPTGAAGDQFKPRPGKASPVLVYRWAAAREALDLLACQHAPDPFDGHLLRYADPATGGEALPTMGCRTQLLPRGFRTRAHRHTISAVYHVAEGSGFSVINGARFNWTKGDTMAIPGWCWHEHATESADAVLFSVTDEPMLKPFNQLRAQELAEGQQTVASTFKESAA
jgi:gentisate 1,2-dioxygenase